MKRRYKRPAPPAPPKMTPEQNRMLSLRKSNHYRIQDARGRDLGDDMQFHGSTVARGVVLLRFTSADEAAKVCPLGATVQFIRVSASPLFTLP